MCYVYKIETIFFRQEIKGFNIIIVIIITEEQFLQHLKKKS